MYIWRIQALAEQLKNQQVTNIDKLKYLIGNLALLFLGLSIFSFLPTLYQIIFPEVKAYLEKQALPAKLTIHVYDFANELFFAATFAIIIMGIIDCYQANRKGDNKRFIERFICLSFPMNMRIIILTGLLCAIIFSLIGAHYTQLLIPLKTKKPTQVEPIKKAPLPFRIVKAINIFERVGKLIHTKLQNLQKATIIFEQISTISFFTYLAMHTMALLSTFWYFFRIRQKINYIASN